MILVEFHYVEFPASNLTWAGQLNMGKKKFSMLSYPPPTHTQNHTRTHTHTHTQTDRDYTKHVVTTLRDHTLKKPSQRPGSPEGVRNIEILGFLPRFCSCQKAFSSQKNVNKKFKSLALEFVPRRWPRWFGVDGGGAGPSSYCESYCECINSAITKPVICGNVVEMGSHIAKGFLFNHTTPFSTKDLEKSLCDFTGTKCRNPVLAPTDAPKQCICTNT